MRVVSKIGLHTANDMWFQRIHIIFELFTCCNGKMSNSYKNREENSTNLCSPASDFLETVVVGAVVVVVGTGVVEVGVGVIVSFCVILPVVDGLAQQTT
jgi:hypothetical protein